MNQVIRATLIGIVGSCVASGAGLACSSATSNASDVGRDAAGGSDGQSTNEGGGSGAERGGGDGSTAIGALGGVVLITRSSGRFSVVADFKTNSVLSAAGCVATTVGPCVALSCPDATGVDTPSLNAGAIMVTGTGAASPVTLVFGTKQDGIAG
jgi:hypothetical protein